MVCRLQSLIAMPLRISQVDDVERSLTTLRVEGDLHFADVLMLENLCRELPEKQILVVDLAGITFLDEESARVLRRLKLQPKIRLTGLRLFTKQMIERQDE